ncbi:MAG TPA: hypothetical protein PLO24_10215 [Bacteroidales bacterium]|nr:hypothetical protein [Bacteroidales bacterium]HOS71549.1 hypothetical protein [Bacteroidales bacterium]HQH23113.1 hypothetical protein [Bacteroidales bacterium]HQJ81029.1 hypothetical protein [Bacteroidales bacterium]
MKLFLKNITGLVILTVIVLSAGLILVLKYGPGFNFGELALLTLTFAILALVSMTIIHKGRKKDADAQVIHLLVAVGIKFITDLVIALVWFFVLKKTSVTLVILFFVLYLAFTLFSVLGVLKTLKYKPL